MKILTGQTLRNKKYLIIMGLFSLLNCSEKYYQDSEKFSEIEKHANISSIRALEIYKSSFESNFNVQKNPFTIDSFYEVIYIYKGFYYIGFANRNDKRDKKTAPLYFLSKIDIHTGEITVVK